MDRLIREGVLRESKDRTMDTLNISKTAEGTEQKEYAEEYDEEIETIDTDSISGRRLRHDTTDITYWTGQETTRTVRARAASRSSSYNSVPEGFYGFYHDGTQYAYSPEENQLVSLASQSPVTVATDEQIVRFEDVSYPEKAVVDGAPQEDVEATVYYRTPRSDEIQSITMNVGHMEGRNAPVWISGSEVEGDRRIEATIVDERVIKTTVPELTLGRVARVEFPKGHRFSLTVEGLTDEAVKDELPGWIENKVDKVFRTKDVELNVSHEGRMER